MAGDKYHWERIRGADEQWALLNPAGENVRHIVKYGPYANGIAAYWRLFLDDGYEDYPSRDEAMDAAAKSLGLT